MSIKVRQSATSAGQGWWKWSVWLEGEDEELDSIASVKYTLHPTFPNPDRVVKARSTNFRLTSGGWGEFNIYIEIRHKNGRGRTRTHWLKLEDGQSEAKSARPGVKKKVKRTSGKSSLRKTGEEEKNHVLFISCSAADMPFTKTLADVLSSEGVEVLMGDEVSSLPWQVQLNFQMARADSAVFVISDAVSRWLESEIKAVRSHNLPVTTIIIADRNPKVPPDLLGAGSVMKIKQMPTNVTDEDVLGEMRSLARRIISKL